MKGRIAWYRRDRSWTTLWIDASGVGEFVGLVRRDLDGEDLEAIHDAI